MKKSLNIQQNNTIQEIFKYMRTKSTIIILFSILFIFSTACWDINSPIQSDDSDSEVEMYSTYSDNLDLEDDTNSTDEEINNEYENANIEDVEKTEISYADKDAAEIFSNVRGNSISGK